MTEHDHQSALIRWANIQKAVIPELGLLYAIPNGGKRHIGTARKLKAEGVKSGVPDLNLPVPRQGCHGFFIEMKADKGKVSPAQKDWIDALIKQGYRVDVCYGWEAAKAALIDYLS